MLSHPTILALFFLLAYGNASNFRIVNNCGSADQWFPDHTSSGTIWADTNGKWSPGPANHSQAEFTLGGPYGDSYDASYIKGTNLNVDICPVDGTYSGNCPCGSSCAYRAFKRPDNQTALVKDCEANCPCCIGCSHVCRPCCGRAAADYRVTFC